VARRPAHSTGGAAQGRLNRMCKRLIPGTVNEIRPGSSRGCLPARVGTGGAGCSGETVPYRNAQESPATRAYVSHFVIAIYMS